MYRVVIKRLRRVDRTTFKGKDMTYYCVKHVEKEKTFLIYVRTKGELFEAVRKVRRKGYIPEKSEITVFNDFSRLETVLK